MAKQASNKAAPAKKASAGKGTAKKASGSKKAPAKKASGSKKAPAKKASGSKKAPAKKAPASKERSTSTRQGRARQAPAQTAAEGAPSFPEAWLADQERALREERAVYLRQADSLQAEADSLVADFEPGDVQFDEESGEGDSLSMERERDLALSAQARSAIEEIDHALAKFPAGTYGICETSGQAIPTERLEAIPWARERVEYKTGGFGRR